jgi:hypothetical protein
MDTFLSANLFTAMPAMSANPTLVSVPTRKYSAKVPLVSSLISG